MAKRAASVSGLFAAAEATLIGLYDGGVLSPAVLQRAMTMMPGRTIRNASKEFFAVIGHIGGIGTEAHDEPDEAAEDEPDDDLINQLAGGRGGNRSAKTARKTPSPGFNPLTHAATPRRGGKS